MNIEDLAKGSERMHRLNQLLNDMTFEELQYLQDILPTIIVNKILEQREINVTDNWKYMKMLIKEEQEKIVKEKENETKS